MGVRRRRRGVGSAAVAGPVAAVPVVAVPVVAVLVASVLVGVASPPAEAIDASRWFFTNDLVGGPAQVVGDFGRMSDTEFFAGDYDADGGDDLAVRRGKKLTMTTVVPGVGSTVSFGKPGDEMFVGDFDGDGADTFAVRRGNVFLIRNRISSGPAQIVIGFGQAGDEVYVGDFDGDGVDTFAVRRGNVFHIRNSISTGVADRVIGYGKATDSVLVGDWDGDGRDTLAVRRLNVIMARNDLRTAPAEITFGFGAARDELHAGDWDGDNFDTFAVRRGGQPVTPIRAAFMYPWFPNAWSQGTPTVPFTNYEPSLGVYDSSDPVTIRAQLELASRAHIDAFITSWWGVGHHTDDALPALLGTTVASGSPDPDMKWAVYYEAEGYSDPSPSEIAADLRYLGVNYFDHPAYLRVDTDPVVFVYSDGGDGSGMAERWREAESLLGRELFTVLRVFSGYRDAAEQPDSWHFYGPTAPYIEFLPESATISPGFWFTDKDPVLARDPSRFSRDVERWNESGATWQVITTWNEWGEGTSIEPAVEYGTTYIDILAANPP